jgi:vitamin B12 transporter
MFEAPPTEIVVTASRAPEEQSESAASVTIIDAARIDRLGEPQVAPLLRLIPSVAISANGPAGSLTEVRIRGAEANHTLLFIEGIRANDPAAGNTPRFELLNADLASRIEVVRGPQSALWGSEAIGGVVAVTGESPGSGGTLAMIEGGSHDSWRGAARTELGDAERGLSVGVAGQRSDGIDAFLGGGERDGYRNLAVRGSGRYRLSPNVIVGASGFALRGESEFDGFNPAPPFQRIDSLDQTRNKLSAGRIFAEAGTREKGYAIASASLLGSSNRNEVDHDPLNRTEANRRTLSLEAGHRFGSHQLIASLEGERETFKARDTAFGGSSNQDRTRRRQSLALEWRASDLGPVSAGVAVRHDIFSSFKDATSLRASAKVDLGSGVSVAANYGEGIAQPSFFDLYGFTPAFFTGNPDLKPERSRGGEISLRYASERLSAALTYHRQRLKDEIVETADFSSTVNATGTSKRSGLEAELGWRPAGWMRLTATYAYLDAEQPQGAADVRERRRPRHSGSIATDGESGRFSYGAAITYTGAHLDQRDSSPFDIVNLESYWLANLRVAYRVLPQVEIFGRVANAFDADYEDVVGYRTEGRSAFAGVRIALGR